MTDRTKHTRLPPMPIVNVYGPSCGWAGSGPQRATGRRRTLDEYDGVCDLDHMTTDDEDALELEGGVDDDEES